MINKIYETQLVILIKEQEWWHLVLTINETDVFIFSCHLVVVEGKGFFDMYKRSGMDNVIC